MCKIRNNVHPKKLTLVVWQTIECVSAYQEILRDRRKNLSP